MYTVIYLYLYNNYGEVGVSFLGTEPDLSKPLGTHCLLRWAAGVGLPIRCPAPLSVSGSGFFSPSCDVGKVRDVWLGDEVRDVLS